MGLTAWEATGCGAGAGEEKLFPKLLTTLRWFPRATNHTFASCHFLQQRTFQRTIFFFKDEGGKRVFLFEDSYYTC